LIQIFVDLLEFNKAHQTKDILTKFCKNQD